MIKIVLFSENKNNIEKILNILGKNSDFEFETAGYLKKHANGWDSKKIKMILLDIAGFSKAGNIIKYNTKIFSRSKTCKLLILDSAQQDLLFKHPLSCDDFLFVQNLEKEMLPRIKFLLYKKKDAIPGDSLVVKDMVLDLEKYELSIDSQVTVLTYKEFEMLKLFMQNIDKVFTRIDLLSAVWGYDYYGGSRTVDVHMRMLRAKIPPPYNDMLKTVRNVGYIFSPGK